MNLTFQKLRISNLDKPGQMQEVNFNLTNEIFPNIKTEADLQGIAVILAGRSAAAYLPLPAVPPSTCKNSSSSFSSSSLFSAHSCFLPISLKNRSTALDASAP